jgi:hypothetical protein
MPARSRSSRSRALGRYVARGGHQPRAALMLDAVPTGFNGFLAVALQTTPEDRSPKSGTDGTLGAPKPKRRPDPPQPAPHPPRAPGARVRRKPRRWDPLATGAHLGGLPGGGPPAAGALNRARISRADPVAPHSARPKNRWHRPPWGSASACRVSYVKQVSLAQIPQFEQGLSRSSNIRPPLWSLLVAWYPGPG